MHLRAINFFHSSSNDWLSSIKNALQNRCQENRWFARATSFPLSLSLSLSLSFSSPSPTPLSPNASIHIYLAVAHRNSPFLSFLQIERVIGPMVNPCHVFIGQWTSNERTFSVYYIISLYEAIIIYNVSSGRYKSEFDEFIDYSARNFHGETISFSFSRIM